METQNQDAAHSPAEVPNDPGYVTWATGRRLQRAPTDPILIAVFVAGRCSSEGSAGRLVQVRSPATESAFDAAADAARPSRGGSRLTH